MSDIKLTHEFVAFCSPSMAIFCLTSSREDSSGNSLFANFRRLGMALAQAGLRRVNSRLKERLSTTLNDKSFSANASRIMPWNFFFSSFEKGLLKSRVTGSCFRFPRTLEERLGVAPLEDDKGTEELACDAVALSISWISCRYLLS